MPEEFLIQPQSGGALRIIAGDTPRQVLGAEANPDEYIVKRLSAPAPTNLVIPPSTAEITAPAELVEQRLYATQRLDAMADYSIISDALQYTSTAGTVSSVTFLVTPDGGTEAAQTGSYEVQFRDQVVVQVEDDATPATLFRFVLEGAVEFAARWLTLPDNTARMEVSDIAPDSVSVPINITSEPLATRAGGSFARTIAQVKAGVGLIPPRIRRDTNLIFDEGIIVRPLTDNRAVTYTLNSDGTPITGQDGVAFSALDPSAVTAQQLADTLTLEQYLDGVLLHTSNAFTEASAGAVTVEYPLSEFTNTSTITPEFPGDALGGQAGKNAFVVFGSNQFLEGNMELRLADDTIIQSTPISHFNNGGSGAAGSRLSACELTLPGMNYVGSKIRFSTKNGVTATSSMLEVIVTDGNIDEIVPVDFVADGTTGITAPISAGNAPSKVVAVVMGQKGAFPAVDDFTWGGAAAAAPTGSGERTLASGRAVGEIADAGSGATSITGTAAASGNIAMIAARISAGA